MKPGRSYFLLLLGSILVTAPNALCADIDSGARPGPERLLAGDGGAGSSGTERPGERDVTRPETPSPASKPAETKAAPTPAETKAVEQDYSPEPDTEAAPEEDIEIRPLTEEENEDIEWELEQMRPPLPDSDEPEEEELPEKKPIPEAESGEGGAQNDKRGVLRAFARLFRRPA